MSFPIFGAFQANGLAKVIDPNTGPSKDGPEPEKISTNIAFELNRGIAEF